MILYELTGTEEDDIYQRFAVDNGSRQYDFIRSLVTASVSTQKAFLSTHIIKALNFQAITCLHTNAGEYRPCPVVVGDHRPPEHYRVGPLMDDFVNTVNRHWESTDPVVLASYVLWRLNYIHPFINGNGRTARAACYFVLCVMAGGWLSGETILPELIRRDRAQYVDALREVDESFGAQKLDLSPLHELLAKLLKEQLGER